MKKPNSTAATGAPAEYISSLYAVRRENLESLFATHGGISGMATKLGVTYARINHIRNQHRGFPERAARSMEITLGLPIGWMDKPHSTTSEQTKTQRSHET